MEDNRTDGTSDRDRKMMGSFESYADKDDDDSEKKSKKAAAKAESKEPDRGLFDFLKVDKPEADEPAPAERKEAAEATPVEELADDEVQQIVQQYVEARTEDLREDMQSAPEDSVEEAVTLANAAFLERVEETGATTDEELDAAVDETAAELELDTDEEDEPAPTTVTATTATGGRGGATPPPPPRVPPAATPAPTPPPPPNRPTTPVAAAAGNVMTGPNPAAANTWTPNRRRAGDLLLGGVVGYLIGRRRGRIKTEARLLPVQEKLEKQVKDLHDKVAEREAKIRRMAAEKVMQEPEAVRPAIVQKIEQRAEQHLPQPEVRPEALGRFALPRTEAIRPVETQPQNIETMTLPDLLVVAEKIERNGVTVREMYVNGRLDVLGLRRVVKEYLQGDRLDQVLSENLRPTESYEALPANRQGMGDSPVAQGAGVTTAATAASQSPLHDAAARQQAANTPEPSLPAPATTQRKLTHEQTGMLIGLATAVIFLVLVFIML